MKSRHKKLALIASGVAILVIVGLLIANALSSNIALYISPTDVADGKAPQGKAFRIGGLVKEGSVKRDGVNVNFIVTDTAKTVAVRYQGILPDLFKEGKGVVAQGKLEGDGIFRAQEVLAKHDENYMPPEAANAVERAQKAQARDTLAKTDGKP